MNFPAYSALLSVCETEKPEWVSVALDSMINQTVKPSEIVLVQNGPVPDEMQALISRYKKEHAAIFKTLILPRCGGLGEVFRQGILACTNGFIAYMDADGYSAPTRIEEEFNALFENKADMVGTNINEFSESINDVEGYRVFPESAEQIYSFAKRRMPMAFSSALFKKRMVLTCCDYEDCYMAEDYALIINLLSFCAKGVNVQKPLVYKRMNKDYYKNRGSWEYIKAMHYFNKKFFRVGWFRYRDFLLRSTVNELIFLMPNFLRTFIFNKMMRT